MAGQSDIETVRGATDLVRLIGEHVALRPKGREHVGLCPFHDDKNPSFAVVTHKGNAFYKCHSCGAGGDAFDFVKNYHRLDFAEALRFLAERSGVTLRPRGRQDGGDERPSARTDLRKANSFAAAFFQRTLAEPGAGAAARDILDQRGISPQMIEAFMLGAAPDQWDALQSRISRQALREELFLAAGLLKPRKDDTAGCYDAFRNRLIFPICDELGNPIAFGARKIDPQDEPKYLNSAESPLFSKSKTLYALHRAKRAIIESKRAIVTEGYTDVIACHQAGLCNVVATLGTALTRDHARLLGRLCDTVVLVFDGDEAGQKAADRGLEVFFAEPVDVKICVLPDGLDPDELLKQNGGRDRLEAALGQAIDALEYKIQRFGGHLRAAGGLSGRQKRLESFLTELCNLGFGSMQGVRKSLVMSHVAELLGVPLSAIEAAMPKVRRTSPGSAGSVERTPSDSSSPHDLAGADWPVPSARRHAEQDVLAVLIYQPELHEETIDSFDGQPRRIADVITMTDFADPVVRIIAEAVFSQIAHGATFSVQQLLAQLAQPQAHALASSLYFTGRQLCEAPPVDPLNRLRQAAYSLRSHVQLEEYHQTVSSYRVAAATKNAPQEALLAAQSVIEHRRRQGPIASAIGRGIRS